MDTITTRLELPGSPLILLPALKEKPLPVFLSVLPARARTISSSLMMPAQLVRRAVVSSSTLLTNSKKGSAVAGQNSTFIPHKGVLSPAENSLYVSTSDGAGGRAFPLELEYLLTI